MAHNYILKVTAGPDYDPSTHQQVNVNQATPMHIGGKHADVQLNVRIQVCSLYPRPLYPSIYATSQQVTNSTFPLNRTTAAFPIAPTQHRHTSTRRHTTTTKTNTRSPSPLVPRHPSTAMISFSGTTLTIPFVTASRPVSVRP